MKKSQNKKPLVLSIIFFVLILAGLLVLKINPSYEKETAHYEEELKKLKSKKITLTDEDLSEAKGLSNSKKISLDKAKKIVFTKKFMKTKRKIGELKKKITKAKKIESQKKKDISKKKADSTVAERKTNKKVNKKISTKLKDKKAKTPKISLKKDLKKNPAKKVVVKKKVIPKKPKKIVYKYSKRFLQIDSNIDEYNFETNLVAIKNTRKNRGRYPSALEVSDHLLVKSKKGIKGDSVVQNKETKYYSVFNKLIKFKTLKGKEKEIMTDLKGFKFKNKNELSMINDVYELQFNSPMDATAAYKKIRSLKYIQWSSIDILEYERIN